MPTVPPSDARPPGPRAPGAGRTAVLAVVGALLLAAPAGAAPHAGGACRFPAGAAQYAPDAAERLAVSATRVPCAVALDVAYGVLGRRATPSTFVRRVRSEDRDLRFSCRTRRRGSSSPRVRLVTCRVTSGTYFGPGWATTGEVVGGRVRVTVRD